MVALLWKVGLMAGDSVRKIDLLIAVGTMEP